MGEAKRRGTREQRIEEARDQAIAKARERTLKEAREQALTAVDYTQQTEEAGKVPSGPQFHELLRGKMLELQEIWALRANIIAGTSSAKRLQAAVFCAVLDDIWFTDNSGACHSSSAVLYMLLAETGFKPELCIGEVKAGRNYFDHSWIELDGEILDAAISFPSKTGKTAFAGGPVFRSIDLSSGKRTNVIYNYNSGEGFALDALKVSQNNLSGYLNLQKIDNQHDSRLIWNHAENIGGRIGISVEARALERKYGAVRRTIRSQQHQKLNPRNAR